MKKLISLSLLVCMAATVFASCGGNGDAPVTEPMGTDSAAAAVTAAETSAADPLAYLPEADYNGYAFRMLTRNYDRWIKDMYVEAENGEVVDDAVYKRNMKVSEEYNIVFKHTPSSHANGETDAVPIILAGDDIYDLVVPHAQNAFVYANQKLFLDWNKDLKYVELDNPWWSQDARNSLSINHKLYAMLGDLSYQGLGACDVMLFNKALFDDYGFEYPYKKAAEGSWTFDSFESIVRDSHDDLNGDGVMNPDDDRYGYVTQHWIGPVEALYVAGQRIISKDENDLPYISLYNDTTVEAFNWISGILDNECSYLQTSGELRGSESPYIKIFASGRGLIVDINMADIMSMRSMDDDFGIIPWPKLDESTEYCTNVDAGTNLFGVPITVTDNDRTSVILEALSCIGYHEVLPAYYSVALQTKFSRDEDSAAMLDIIKASRVFDLGYFNSALVPKLNTPFKTVLATTDRSFASWYASVEQSSVASMEKLVAVYLEEEVNG